MSSSVLFMHGYWACRTIADHVEFVPYGKSVNDDPARIKYMTDMKGYCKKRLLPCFDVYEQTKGSLPKHLAEVTVTARICMMVCKVMIVVQCNGFRVWLPHSCMRARTICGL